MEDDINTMDGDNTSVSSTERRDKALGFKSGSKDFYSRRDEEHPLRSSGDEGRAAYRMGITQRNIQIGQKSVSESETSHCSRKNEATRNLLQELSYTPRSSTQSSSPTKTATNTKSSSKNVQEITYNDRDSSPTITQERFKYNCNKQRYINVCQKEISVSSLSNKETCSPQNASPKTTKTFIDDELSETIRDIDENLFGLNEELESENFKITAETIGRRTEKVNVKSTGSSSNPTSTDITDSANDATSSRSSYVSPPTSTRDPDSSPNHMIYLPSEIRLQDVEQTHRQSPARIRRRNLSLETSPQKAKINSVRPVTVDDSYNREQPISTSPGSLTDSHNEMEENSTKKDLHFQYTCTDACVKHSGTNSPRSYSNKIHNSNDESENEIILNFPQDMIKTPCSSRKSGSENENELNEVSIPGCIVSPRKVRLSPVSPHITRGQRTVHYSNIPDIPEEVHKEEEKLSNVFNLLNSITCENTAQDDKPSYIEVSHCTKSNWFPENNKTDCTFNYPNSKIGGYSTPRTVSEGKPTTVDIAEVISKIQNSRGVNKEAYDILIRDLENTEGMEAGDDGLVGAKTTSPRAEVGPSKVETDKLTKNESDVSTTYSVSIMETTQDDHECICLRNFCESILNFFFSRN